MCTRSACYPSCQLQRLRPRPTSSGGLPPSLRTSIVRPLGAQRRRRRRCARHEPGPVGALRAIALATGAAATPRSLRRQRKRAMRGAAPRASAVAARGDQSFSATAASRGHTVGCRSDASTVSPHISPCPPRICGAEQARAGRRGVYAVRKECGYGNVEVGGAGGAVRGTGRPVGGAMVAGPRRRAVEGWTLHTRRRVGGGWVRP